MQKKLRLSIVTPESLALETSADFVALPAWEGEMGVLPGHASYMAQLREGVLRYKEGSMQGTYSISGGFAEIHKNSIAVFAEAAELPEQIDEERAAQALNRAKKALSQGAGMDLDAAQAAMRRALVRLKVARLRRKSRAPKPH